jgi:hypothetical protein
MSLKKPDNLPLWLIKIGVWLNKPYGVSLEIMEKRTWESVEKYFNKTSLINLYWGFVFISVGESPSKKA